MTRASAAWSTPTHPQCQISPYQYCKKFSSNVFQNLCKFTIPKLTTFHGTSATSVPSGEPCSSQCDRRSGIELRSNYGPLEPEQFTKRIEEIVAFFLDRTCGAPFSFKFCMKRRYTYDVRPILMRLIVHSEQWEEVSIDLHPYELVYFCGAKGRLPLLKMLDICTRG